MKKKKFSIVIAVDDKNGIGKNGTLAWRIKEDMQFFRTLTTTTKKSHRQNAVIMGRKTWESIPERFRPLPGRVNCVLSSSYNENPTIITPTTFGFNDFEDCHEFLSRRVDIEHIFIIGGSYLYNLVLDFPCLENIYLTKVSGDFWCDTFFSPIPEKFSIVESGEIKKENTIEYQMLVYKNTDKRHFTLPEMSKKNIIFTSTILWVLMLLFLVSFVFTKKSDTPSPEINTQPEPENSQETEILNDSTIWETTETETPELALTPETPLEKKETTISWEWYSITYPIETSIDDTITSFVDAKKLEYKIKNFNAKNAGNIENWEIQYEIQENEIVFTEIKSGESISETKIPLE